MQYDQDGNRAAVVTDTAISGFFGEYSFLSNFFLTPVRVAGIIFPSSEHAYMACKTLDQSERLAIAAIEKPSKAKAFGRTVTLRRNWDDIREGMMFAVLAVKFTENPELLEKLLETGNKYLEESNDWGDTFWGTVNGVGKNKLGKILMSIRDEIHLVIDSAK